MIRYSGFVALCACPGGSGPEDERFPMSLGPGPGCHLVGGTAKQKQCYAGEDDA